MTSFLRLVANSIDICRKRWYHNRYETMDALHIICAAADRMHARPFSCRGNESAESDEYPGDFGDNRGNGCHSGADVYTRSDRYTRAVTDTDRNA